MNELAVGLLIIAICIALPILIPLVIYYARIAWLRAEQRFFKTNESENENGKQPPQP